MIILGKNKRNSPFVTCCLLMLLSMLPLKMIAQDAAVTLNINNQSVQTFIKEVERQTRYTFVYRNSVLDPQTKVSVVCRNRPLGAVLNKVLSPLNVDYSINNNTIVLTRKKSAINAAAHF